MKFIHMPIVSFLFNEFKAAINALHTFTQVNDPNVPIEMMFVAKCHDAVTTFVIFCICVRYHMPFEMRSSLESFPAIFLFAYIISTLAVSFSHMPIEMREFLKEFAAYLASLIFLLVHIS